MTIAELPVEELQRRLRRDGISLDFGLIRARIRANVPALAESLHCVYGAFPLSAGAALHDVTATLRREWSWRQRFRPQVQFVLDGDLPFEALPAATHLPMLEWGLNWCIASRCHRHLLLHAGVVARDDLGVLIPAVPGSGKSTLTAALACRGYRLLSDEFGVVRLRDHRLLPLVRPIALKNESIEVIGRFAPEAVIGPRFRNTRKGDVAHVAPTSGSVAQRHAPAQPALILFPQYRAGALAELEPVDEAMAFIKVSGNSFNYELLGEAAFQAVAQLVQRCRTYRITYSCLEDAIALIDGLLQDCIQPLAVGQS